MVQRKLDNNNSYSRLKDLYFNRRYIEFIKGSTKYLQKYPHESNLRFMRAKAYRALKQYSLAIYDLKYLLINDSQNKYALVELFFLHYYLNNYKEALKLLPLLYEKQWINPMSLSIAEQVMKKQLGIEIKLKKNSNIDYIRSQIFNYSDSLALLHCEGHFSNNQYKESFSCFKDNINLKYLFNTVRKSIVNENKTDTNEVLETHYFAINNVGYYCDDICNFLKVVVVPNTDNIITMYPVNKVSFAEPQLLDVDYEKLFNTNEKVKQKSRIDKFNERYKIV